jgi:type III secretory pathway component EscS
VPPSAAIGSRNKMREIRISRYSLSLFIVCFIAIAFILISSQRSSTSLSLYGLDEKPVAYIFFKNTLVLLIILSGYFTYGLSTFIALLSNCAFFYYKVLPWALMYSNALSMNSVWIFIILEMSAYFVASIVGIMGFFEIPFFHSVSKGNDRRLIFFLILCSITCLVVAGFVENGVIQQINNEVLKRVG